MPNRYYNFIFFYSSKKISTINYGGYVFSSYNQPIKLSKIDSTNFLGGIKENEIILSIWHL